MEQPAAKRRRVEIVPEEFLYGNIPPNEKKQQPKNNNTCTRVQRYFSISTNQQSHFQSAEAFILPQPMSVYQNVNSTFAFCIPFQFSSPFINQLGFGPPDQAFFQSNIQPPLQIMQQNDWANRNVFSSYRFQRTSSMRYNHYHKIHCRQSFTQKNVHTPSQHFRLYNTPPSNQMMKQNGMTYNNNNLVQRSPSNPAKQQTHRNPTQGFNPNFINGAKHTTFKFVPDPSKK